MAPSATGPQGGITGGQAAYNGGNAAGGAAGHTNGAASLNGQNGNNHGPAGLVYPALHLHPLNDTFAPKQISLSPPSATNRVKIGRQTNNKTVPHPTNGFFDSKVLSRTHAEVWSQDGKIFIKDVGSSNGTFINKQRLSEESKESSNFELRNEDLVEFGIDIVGDDNKTIIHHKVEARVYLVITAEEALGMRSDFASLYRGGGHGGVMGGSGMGPGAEGGLRRGKSGMSFEHIFSKLQSELQRSRDHSSELGGLAHAITEVGETMQGGMPPMQNPPYQHMVPAHPSDSSAPSTSVAALQEQLASTQASLAEHVEKIRNLESVLAEHESIKQEVDSMKAQIQEVAAGRGSSVSGESLAGDFDDGASIASMDTVTGGTTGRRSPRSMLAQTRAAPSSAGAGGEEALHDLDASSSSHEDEHEGPRAPPDEPPHTTTAALMLQNQALSGRLEALEGQLEEALTLGRGLQAQHASASEAVRTLEGRMVTLEKEVVESEKRAQGAAVSALEGRWAEWRATLEAAWTKERQGWADEREQMRRVVQAWDQANASLESEAQIASTSSVRRSPSASTSSRGSSPRSKNAKRGAGKRHVNPVLRSLLYTQSHLEEGSTDDDDDDAESRGVADGQSEATRSVGSSASGESAEPTSTAATSPAGSVAGKSHSSRAGAGASSSAGLKSNPFLAMLSKNGSVEPVPAAMAAASLFAVGIAWYAYSGKSGTPTRLT
ncbi:FOG: FHA domain [Ceraceosorus bombacis]|uniref:FOG: FHA domain n=1 Tax=Ceraceosorus bombacis TaxID=401625 RepID=A0A0N7L9H3_9BASI|nr:FOG: FHA domain [Ceraceosorus bombacis]